MSGPIDVQILKTVIELQRRFAGQHPALERCHPIAIVSDGSFHIFDLDETGEHYRYIHSSPSSMPVPEGVRAAFPLEEYGGQIVCVVTPDVFDEPGGYVTILHEFVHCHQFSNCEMALKAQLSVAQQAEKNGDHMWEIQHPFPYQDADFVEHFECFLSVASENDLAGAEKIHLGFKAFLDRQDFEYLVWQEWKEGMARWLENCIRRDLGLPVNLSGVEQPYSRVSFYASGAALIELIHREDPDLVADLPALFQRLFSLS